MLSGGKLRKEKLSGGHVGKPGLWRPEADLISRSQLSSFDPADLRLQVGGAAAHDHGHVKTACKRHVSPASSIHAAEAYGLPRLYKDRLIPGQGISVHLCAQVAAGNSNQLILCKFHYGSHHGHFQDRLVFIVSHQNVRQCRSPGVHDAGHGHSRFLAAVAAHVLDRCEETSVQDPDPHYSTSLWKTTYWYVPASTCFSMASYSASSTARNFIYWPASRSTGFSRSAS